MPARITREVCIGCGACQGVCPTQSLTFDAEGITVCNEETCISCGACAETCPVAAIEIVE